MGQQSIEKCAQTYSFLFIQIMLKELREGSIFSLPASGDSSVSTLTSVRYGSPFLVLSLTFAANLIILALTLGLEQTILFLIVRLDTAQLVKSSLNGIG